MGGTKEKAAKAVVGNVDSWPDHHFNHDENSDQRAHVAAFINEAAELKEIAERIKRPAPSAPFPTSGRVSIDTGRQGP
jgi:hypothetical protein